MTTSRQLAKPNSAARPAGATLQRACACGKHTAAGGECAECAQKREQGLLQRAAIAAAPAPDVAPPIVHDVLRTPGQPLDEQTRAFVEPRFGQDFGDVRVHTDAQAAESARSVGALAYTVGNHVAFGAGQYQPSSSTGQRLLAHELAHVVQQGRQRLASGTKAETAELEQSARATADAVISRGHIPAMLPAAPIGLARQAKVTIPKLTFKELEPKRKYIYSIDGLDFLVVELPENAQDPVVFGIELAGDSNTTSRTITVTQTGNVKALLIPMALYGLQNKGYVLQQHFIPRATEGEGRLFVPEHPTAPPKPKKQATKAQPAPTTTSAPTTAPTATPASASPASAAKTTKSPDELIDEHTSFFNLDEEQLGTTLLQYALDSEIDLVQRTLDALGSTDRDDVAYELTLKATDEQLDQLATPSEGQRLLDRLYDELSSGYASADELQQGDRILKAKARRIDPQKFVDADTNAMVIPFSSIGITKLSSASIDARRLPNGKIFVRSYMKPEHYKDARRLPSAKILYSGVEVDPDEVVGIHLYDEGGEVIYVPALYLLQLGNQEDSKALRLAGEAFATGLTLGLGGGAVAGGEAVGGSVWLARGATALRWADRAALVLTTASTLINDHRGLIIEKTGEDGRRFLEHWAKVDRVLAIYGYARGVVALGQVTIALKQSYSRWRITSQQLKNLSDDERKIFEQMSGDTEKALKQLEDARAATTNPQSGAAIETPGQNKQGGLSVIEGGGKTTPPRQPNLTKIEGGKGGKEPKPPTEPAAMPRLKTGTDDIDVVEAPSNQLQQLKPGSAANDNSTVASAGDGSGKTSSSPVQPAPTTKGTTVSGAEGDKLPSSGGGTVDKLPPPYTERPFAELEELAKRGNKQASNEIARRQSLRFREPKPPDFRLSQMTYRELDDLALENRWAWEELQARTSRLDKRLRQYRDIQSQAIIPGTNKPVGPKFATGPGKSTGGTLAVGETDVPVVKPNYEGASPQAGGPPVKQGIAESDFSPDNLKDTRGMGHAEERVFSSFDTEVQQALKSGKLGRNQLNGKTLRMHVEDFPCQTCKATTGSQGPIAKFMQKYPELRLEITDIRSGESLIYTVEPGTNALQVARQGIKVF